MPARVPRAAARLARRARGRARRGRREKARTSPLRVFDVEASPPTRKLLAAAPKIGESLCDACVEHFAAVRADLDATGVRYELVPTLVRGLDYYSRTTWEFVGPMDERELDDLRRRPLRLPRRGDRRPADARRRLRRRDRAAADRDGGRGRARPRTRRPSTSSSRRAGRAARARRAARCSDLRDRGVAADTDYAGRSLKGQLTQARPLRRAHDRDPPRRPTRSCAARASRTNRSLTPTSSADCRDDLARPTCAASPARSSSASS